MESEAKMIRYSDEILEDVRQSNDIVNIISQYVALKRKGRNYFGLCPFHNEKSPSFQYHQIGRYSIVSDAMLVEMYTHF